MQKLTCLLAFLIVSLACASAQDPSTKFSKNIFVEGFGNGILVSINYDMRLKKGVGSSRVDLQACKLEYSIVSPK